MLSAWTKEEWPPIVVHPGPPFWIFLLLCACESNHTTTSPVMMARQPQLRSAVVTDASDSRAAFAVRLTLGDSASQVWVQVARDSSFLQSLQTETVGVPSGDSTVTVAVAVNGLTPGSSYFARPFAKSGASVWTRAVLTFRTLSGPPLPAPPGNLTATPQPNGVLLDWRDNSADENHFLVQLRSANGSWNDLAIVPADSTKFIHTGLFPGVAQTYRVAACTGTQCSAPSNEAAAAALAQGPVAITDGAFILSSTNVLFTARANANGQASTGSFEISQDRGFAVTQRTPVRDLGAGLNLLGIEETISNLEIGKRYYYRFIARNASATTIGNTAIVDTRPPLAPGLAVSPDTGYSVRVEWQVAPETGGSWHVLRSTDGANRSEIFLFDYTPVGGQTVGRDITYDVQTPHLLEYAVFACNGLGCGDTTRSRIASIPLPAPMNLRVAAATDTTGTMLQWDDNSAAETGFHIYRRTVTGAFQLIGTNGRDVREARDYTALRGITYYYMVTAFVHNDGPRPRTGSDRDSSPSNEAAVTIQ